LIAVERAAGERRQLRVVVDADVVDVRRHAVADDDRFERLPLASGLAGIRIGSFPTVNRAEALTASGRPADRANLKLQLITAPQVEAAVLTLVEQDFRFRLEVLELFLRVDVAGRELSLTADRVGHRAVLELPAVLALVLPSLLREAAPRFLSDAR